MSPPPRDRFDDARPASRIGRRRLLTGLASSLALTAVTRGLRGDPPPPPPKRLVLVMQNNGTQQANFWPRGGFTSPILEPLLSDPAIAKRAAVVRGLFVPADAAGTDANEHDMGFARMFTGSRLVSIAGHPWGGGPSVDQIVAKEWGIGSLTLAVLASAVEPRPKPGLQHRRSFSYVAAGTHKLPTVNPFDAYRRLFAFGDASTDEARRDLALRRSALDAVRGDLGELQGQLGPRERAKLEVHLSSIRDLEVAIGRTIDGGRCASTPVAPRNYASTPGLLVNDEAAIPEIVDEMTSLIATSIGCGLTRVATLQLGFGGGKWRYAWEGINMDMHGELAHKDTSDAGSSADNTAKLVKVNRYYAGVVAGLARKLDAIPEADGSTALDHTLIVWVNEFGRGDHSLANVPLVLLGGAGCGVKTGGRFVDQGPQTFQRLGCTVLRAMGIPADGFGDEPTCGAIAGL